MEIPVISQLISKHLMGLQRPSVGPQFKLLFLTVFQKVRGKFPFELVFPTYLNPLSSNPTK